MNRSIKILGTGKYLPEKVVYSKDLDEKLGLSKGWTEKKSGVKSRHYVDNETASDMGAIAVKRALLDANLTMKDIDCMISTSGTYEQAIPYNASLIQEKLGWQGSRIPAFDINSTCLSFVTGLDVISHLVHNGVYKNVLLISSEIASVGLDWEQKESSVLFGDAAVAVIITKNDNNDGSKIISSLMETYSEGAHMTEIRGGGTKYHPRNYSSKTEKEFLFDMNGRAVFKLASKEMNGFIDRLFKPTNLTMSDIDLVVPHQASGMAMRILRGKLGIPEERFMDIIENHGNTIASSIPIALHEAIKQGKIERGSKVLLLGTSAGLSIGGIILEY